MMHFTLNNERTGYSVQVVCRLLSDLRAEPIIVEPHFAAEFISVEGEYVLFATQAGHDLGVAHLHAADTMAGSRSEYRAVDAVGDVSLLGSQ